MSFASCRKPIGPTLNFQIFGQFKRPPYSKKPDEDSRDRNCYLYCLDLTLTGKKPLVLSKFSWSSSTPKKSQKNQEKINFSYETV